MGLDWIFEADINGVVLVYTLQTQQQLNVGLKQHTD